ncbi:MAG: class II glutamine amidotransferase, partial [Aeromonas sp.]
MAGRITEGHKKAFRDLLVMDSLRGPHSTGICVADRMGTGGFVKKVGNPYELFDTKLFDTAMTGTKSVLLGHNRWATKGAINSTNAHPFEFGKIIGAHNGTLRQQSLLDDWTKFDVDSENLYYHMERHGVQATVPKLNGAYALTWHDAEDHSVNLLRNDERPLTYCYSKDHKTLYWASEGWMLMAALHRNNLDHGEIYALPVNKHYKFLVPGGFVNAEKVFEAPVIATTEPYKAVVINYGPAQGKYQSASGSATTKTAGSYPALTNDQKTAMLQMYRPYLGVDCKFVVFTEAKTSTGEYYLHCVHHEDENIELRVFTPRGGELWNKMMNSCHGFQGHTKRYSPEEGGYLLVDIRSIIELPDLF